MGANMPMCRIMSDGKGKGSRASSHRRTGARQRKDRLSSSAKNSRRCEVGPIAGLTRPPPIIRAGPAIMLGPAVAPVSPPKRSERGRGGWGAWRNANGLKRCGCSCCCMCCMEPCGRGGGGGGCARRCCSIGLRNVEMKPSSLLPRRFFPPSELNGKIEENGQGGRFL